MTALKCVETEVSKGLRISRSTLLAELALIQTVIERKNTIPILSKILIEADCRGTFAMRGTDLDVSFTTAVTAMVAEQVSVAVDARKLFDIVRSLPDGDIDIALQGNGWITVCAGSARFKLAAESAEHFPAAPGSLALEHRISAEALGRSIDRVVFAITREESRYNLAGALLVINEGTFRFVATDGHRLATDEIPVEGPAPSAAISALFPRKGLAALRKLVASATGSVAVGIDDNQIQVRVGERILTSRRLDGTFPDYEKVMPKSNNGVAVISRQALESTLGRVLLVADERSRSVSIEISEGRATLRAKTSEIGEAIESIDLDGGVVPVTVGVNGTYFLDFLAVAGSDQVRLSYRDARTQLLLEPVGEETEKYTMVVMPLRGV